ncbi:MAG: glutamate synthase large subunit [Gammaproteobacteria bacterium]|nr:glutamate synthase large subunit [Gammaproteobacteria bacterium]
MTILPTQKASRPLQSIGLYDPRYEKDSCGVGFICDIKGRASRGIMEDANHMNCCMVHRGGLGYEKNTGDGAGILTAIPHRFFARVFQEQHSKTLPQQGLYGVGVVFLPQAANERHACQQALEQVIQDMGQTLLGWREVPVAPDAADIGGAARAAMPYIANCFIGGTEVESAEELERKLYLIRKQATHRIKASPESDSQRLFYIASLSTKVIVYKGMLTPIQLYPFFPDLQAEDYESHLAMVHSRFSTNTFPSWDRAQPNRFMSHNGEINTLLGNTNWMNAREGVADSELFGEDLYKAFPIVEPDCSDSGTFDNVLEFMLMTGRTLQESVLMMIPEAWQHHDDMPDERKAFYEFNSCLMEPWDGPASIAFTDGNYIGAVLDRNGLRPSRYYITSDDRCIMASEVGVLDVDPATVVTKGRLQPGKLFLIDFTQGRMVPDDEIKSEWAAKRPWRHWLDNQRIDLDDLPVPSDVPGYEADSVLQRMQAHGYTTETMQFMLVPMVKELRDPLGSMGNDAALAVMSDKPRMLYDYFKQLFAQVTNPAIDSIREEIIMALECYIGPEQNLLDISERHAKRLRLAHPILNNAELAAIQHMDYHGWRTKTIDITFPVESDAAGLTEALLRISNDALQAIEAGYKMVVLSDRQMNQQCMPISALLAVGAVHHHLVKHHARTRIGLVVETGEAREVHHHCLLIGYGADAINPYLAFESLWQSRRDGYLDDAAHVSDDDDVVDAYKKAVAKGMMKVMAKMGISTLQSYKGAQIFEAVGLAQDVVDLAFTGTASRVEGIGFDVLVEEMRRRHEIGFPGRNVVRIPVLPNPGDFHWRLGGDRHMWDPEAIADLQYAARENDEDAYWRFAQHVNELNTREANLRGLITFVDAGADKAVPLDEVEPESEIMKRFATGAMSFGSISAEAHESLAIAMNRVGGKSNSGEGGEDSERFYPDANGDWRRSAIKQVASGRFGVTIDYLTNADQLQIKIVQGAKPGEGGELPGTKVDGYIARIRNSTPGVGLISPPPHHDIYSIEDIAQLIHDLKNANPDADISVKLCSEVGVGTVAAGVTKARTDHLVIAGDVGGTGASPLTSIKHAGIPWELGLAETHQTLVLNNLRSRVALQVDGQLKTGRDVAIAICLGAEEFGFATAPLVSLGCIMMRKCHLNTCPVGIATQDPELRKHFAGTPEHVLNYLFMVAKELRLIMAAHGIRNVNEMVGHVELLKIDAASDHWKANALDLEKILMQAEQPDDCLGVYRQHKQDHGLEDALDKQLIKLSQPALTEGKKVRESLPIRNTHRVVGGMLSNAIIKHVGPDMLPDDTIHFKLTGSAGQSFGAWLAKGVTLEVEGDANDYVGKGLSGGRLIVYPPKNSIFHAEHEVLIGNVVLYGATSGECFFRGIAAERFCVRNSGATAIVEGVGDHGCEYMTGGRVVVLGPTGRNFAAGMSGGIAYVWDPEKDFANNCNMELVDLEQLEQRDEIDEIKRLIDHHAIYTGSTVAKSILDNWTQTVRQFVKVMPTDYKRVLQSMAEQAELASAEV